MAARPAALVLSALALACASLPWVSHPMPRPPDRSCRTGGGVGHDIYTWDCIDGEHVVISRYCGGFVGCQEPQRELAACGQPTQLEQRLAMYLEDCPASPQPWPAP